MEAKHTRGKFLKAVGAGTVCIALLNVPGCKPSGKTQRNNSSAQLKNSVQTFRSRPDLSPSTLQVGTEAHDTAPGYVFVAPKRGSLTPKNTRGQEGAMILDNSGNLVWFYSLEDVGKSATDFRVQQYKGEPVLTWWEGALPWRNGGEYLILDGSYKEITRVRAGNGYKGDLHEFNITSQDTALITIYDEARRDLSSLGGLENGVVLNGIAQEIDIETGEVLFEWHSLDHVGVDESYSKPPTDRRRPFDYFHINAIDVDHDGNLLIDSKRTCTVYKVDRKSGEIMWRLGGKKSDFEMGPGTRTHQQHDARRQPDGTITIFDNNGGPGLFDSSNGGNVTQQSRGIVLKLNEDKMTATLLREYTHPKKMQSALEGNMQTLPNGDVFIGWGSEPFLSEFSKDGELLFDADFVTRQQSYRAFRLQWSGQPKDDPAIAVESGPDDEVRVYASWNGATEVESWQVLAGPDPDRLKSIASAPRDGFETVIKAQTKETYVGVRAKNGSGQVLGASKAIKARKPKGV